MNIFVTSKSPKQCARALDDLRLGKMILETAQMLCTVLNLEAGKQVTPYKNSHATNPLVLWAAERDEHWLWLWNLGEELGNEYVHRFGKKHASHLIIQGLHFRAQSKFNTTKEPKRWHNAAAHKKLGLDFKHLPVREAYRAYLKARWKLQAKSGRPPTWTNRGQPSWL